MMHLINQQFTFHHIEDKFEFITNSDAFKFNQKDMFNFNTSFRKLIKESTKMSKTSQ